MSPTDGQLLVENAIALLAAFVAVVYALRRADRARGIDRTGKRGVLPG